MAEWLINTTKAALTTHPGFHVITDLAGDLVALIPIHENDDEDLRRARLIAAAPALLRALKMARGQVTVKSVIDLINITLTEAEKKEN
jgi:hypothetical protein